MDVISSADGTTIAYEIHNPNASRIPLLMTHGYSATSSMWAPNIDALAAERPVLVYDQRGHGQSGAPEDPSRYSEAASIADVDVLIDELGVDRAILLGMSLGGYITLAYHLAHPQRVAAMVLQDTGPGYKSDTAREAWNKVCEQLTARVVAAGSTGGTSPEVTAAHHNNPAALALVAEGVLKQRDARVINSLPTIAVPTTVIVGEHDTNYLAGSDYMQSRIPGAEKIIIPDAGHAANIDQPEAFNAAVLTAIGAIQP